MNKFSLLTLGLFVAASTGCGGAPEGGVPVFEVSGSIKMNGAVLPDATVIFSPEGDQPTATGKTDSEGNFTLTTYEFGDGAAEGSYKVLISKVMSVGGGGDSGGGEDDYDGGHEAAAEEGDSHKNAEATPETNLVPPKYSSADSTPETAEVTSGGDNTFSFELTP